MMEEVNLNLNFGPDPVVSLELATNNASAGLSDVANEPFSMRRFGARPRSRSRRIIMLPVPTELRSRPARELSQLMNSPVENGNNKVMEEDNVTEEKSGSFFDCYICMDLCKDPVVTNCGHLYCWSCLYRWLEVSNAKECPVCRGEVSVKTLTPIYGRGDRNKRESEEVSDTNKIPSRPQARRVERLRSRLERPGNGFMTSRRVRAEQNQSNAAVVAPVGETMRNQERNNIPSVGVGDRDSVSSIMNSESQIDTVGAEIDSMVTVYLSVGRPHENGSRFSDVDSADARPLRRRRRRLA